MIVNNDMRKNYANTKKAIRKIKNKRDPLSVAEQELLLELEQEAAAVKQYNYDKLLRSRSNEDEAGKARRLASGERWRKRSQKKINGYYRNRKAEYKKRAIEYKGGKCSKCSGVFPSAVYDFHHTDPKEKDQLLSRMLGSLCVWDRMVEELNKCVLLCANCHRIEHNPEETHELRD